MRRTSKLSAIAGVVTLGIGLVGMSVLAQDGPKVVRSARGGDLVTTLRIKVKRDGTLTVGNMTERKTRPMATNAIWVL